MKASAKTADNEPAVTGSLRNISVSPAQTFDAPGYFGLAIPRNDFMA
jgi:hypothetical protein